MTDEASLADALAQTLELETVPQENETPDEPTAEADGEEGTEEVLSQPEEEAEAADEPAAEETAEADESEPGDEVAEEPDDAEETPRGVQKRIDKLTKRAKRAEEEDRREEEEDYFFDWLIDMDGEPPGRVSSGGPAQAGAVPTTVSAAARSARGPLQAPDCPRAPQ